MCNLIACLRRISSVLVLGFAATVGMVQAAQPTAPPPRDALLNIDFVNSEPWYGVAATGNGPRDYWNFSLPINEYYTELTGLLWSTGDLSPVSAVIENAPGVYGNGHPNPMMYGYLYTYGPEAITVTLSNLPNGTYDVYVYAHGGPPDDQNAVISAEAGGENYGPEITTTDASWLSTTWVEGSQYVLLEGVSVAAGTPLVIRSTPGASGYSFLNGIQLRQTSKHAKKPKHTKKPKVPKDALLNIDFVNSEPWIGVAATGNSAGDFWNPSPVVNQYFTELFDLKWSNGELSPVSATIENAPGVYGNGHPNPMMYGYLYTYGSETISVTLSDLPGGTYDVYVYAHGGPPDDQNAVIAVEANGTIYGPEITTTTGDWLSTTWVEGAQYVLLPRVTVAEGGSVIVRSSPGASGYSFLNGLQLRRVSKR